MSEYKKCTFKNDGYADYLCKNLSSIIEYYPTKRSKGVFVRNIVNINTSEDKGGLVVAKSGDHIPKGFAFNYCPFCGELLRDTSDD